MSLLSITAIEKGHAGSAAPLTLRSHNILPVCLYLKVKLKIESKRAVQSQLIVKIIIRGGQ